MLLDDGLLPDPVLEPPPDVVPPEGAPVLDGRGDGVGDGRVVRVGMGVGVGVVLGVGDTVGSGDPEGPAAVTETVRTIATSVVCAATGAELRAAKLVPAVAGCALPVVVDVPVEELPAPLDEVPADVDELELEEPPRLIVVVPLADASVKSAWTEWEMVPVAAVAVR